MHTLVYYCRVALEYWGLGIDLFKNNKRALKHALFQEKSNIGEIHGLSTQKWGRERKGEIRSTLSFTNLDTVSSLKWGQNSKMAGSTAAAVFFFFLKKAFLNFEL